MSKAHHNPKRSASAGGVMVRKFGQQNKILLIKDDQIPKWVLPKGHIKKGETEEQAAQREVFKETGLKKIKLVKKLGTKERERYVRPDEWKTIHYFLFIASNGDKPAPQEKKHHDLRWFAPEKAVKVMQFSEQKEIVEENMQNIASI